MMRLCKPSPVQALKTGILVRVVPLLKIGRRAKLKKKKLEKYRANTPNLDFEAVISAVARVVSGLTQLQSPFGPL